MIYPSPFHIDGFAGGGGASEGWENATGIPVAIALNHDPEAVAMHRMNHPLTEHHCEDIRTADPVKLCRGRRPSSAWFSPDCKDFSKAKGGKPKSKRIRGLAWTVLHWVNRLGPNRPLVIYMENVEEFAEWCPLIRRGKRKGQRNPKLLGWFFQCFTGALRRRGYTVEWRELRACERSKAPTIRKRLYLVARFLRRHGVKVEGEFAMCGEFVIVDIGMRMLTARELYRAQGFGDDYIIDRGMFLKKDGTLEERPLTKTAQVRMCGNSVCPPMAEALIRCNQPEYALEEAA